MNIIMPLKIVNYIVKIFDFGINCYKLEEEATF